MKQAYGGVLIDLSGQVLLREAADHRGQGGWTFAKGKPKLGETPEDTALREVLEETGLKAKVLAKIPGRFVGSRRCNEYFLMLPLEDTGTHDGETLSIRWVPLEEAIELISQSRRPNRRARDLQLLRAAFELLSSMFGAGERRGPAAPFKRGSASEEPKQLMPSGI